MEKQIKDHEDTIRIIKNILELLREVEYCKIEQAAKQVEAYAFCERQVKHLEASLAKLQAPNG